MMEYHGNDVWSTNLGKHRGEINGDTVPSFYVDGGKRNHKKDPEVQFTIVVGTVIYIRPAVSKRADENMHILEFRAVEVIDVDAGIIFETVPIMHAKSQKTKTKSRSNGDCIETKKLGFDISPTLQ